MEILSVAKTNLKTTIPGVITFVIAVLSQLIYQFDTDPATSINFGVIISALFVMLGFGVAQDGPGIKAMEASLKLTMPTLFGILSFVGLALSLIKVAFDADPETTIDWASIVMGLFTLFGLINTSDKGIKSLANSEGNPKLFAIISFFSTLSYQIAYLFDNVPATNPDWGLIISALLAAVGLSMAK